MQRRHYLASAAISLLLLLPATALAGLVYYANAAYFAVGSERTTGFANRQDNQMYTNSAIPPNRPVQVFLRNTIEAYIANTEKSDLNNVYKTYSPAIYSRAVCQPPSPHGNFSATCRTNTQ